MKIKKLTVFLLTILSSPANAYNLEAHAQMTRIAFDRSMLVRDPELLKRLGIDRLDERFPFGNGNSEICTNIPSQNNLFRNASTPMRQFFLN